MPDSFEFQLPSLLVYTNVRDGKNFVIDITPWVQSWQRSIRLQGGYWLGSLKVSGNEELMSWLFNNAIGYHLEERSGGLITWEGLIYEIDLNESYNLQSGRWERALDIQVAGYVFTANWRYVTRETADGTTTNISKWIKDILNNHCSDYLIEGKIQTNLMQYTRRFSKNLRAWDAIVEATELGDVAAYPYRSYVTNGRLFVYEQISNQPIYHLRHGSTRRRSLATMVNHVRLTYTSSSGAEKRLPAIQQDQSIANFGRKEDWLYIDTVPQATAENIQRRYLAENAWPHSKTIGGIKVEVVGLSGDNALANPWQIRPGVVRDYTYPAGPGQNVDSWFEDLRDFLVDEVSCGTNSGLSLSTKQFAESAILIAQAEYTAWLERERKTKK